jgi:plasmid maintenance system antidote protein VapI
LPLLGRCFGNKPRFWLNLQTAFDPAEEIRDKGERIAAEMLPAQAA